MTSPTPPAEPKARDAGAWARQSRNLQVAHVPAGAVNINVEGRGVAGPLQGFGPLWQKTYSVRLAGANASPTEVVAAWKAHFPEFQPRQNRFYPSLAGVQPGEIVLLNATVGGIPVNSGVLVLYADDESFTLMTPQGLPETGWIMCSAFEDGGVTVAQIQTQGRSADPIYEVGFRLLGARAQERIWSHVLRQLAAYFGLSDQPVALAPVCLDPRIRWAGVRNVWSNAGVRTILYLMAAPLRWLIKPRRNVSGAQHATAVAPSQAGESNMTTPTPSPSSPSSPVLQTTEPRDAAYWARQGTNLRVSAQVPAGAINMNVEGRSVVSPLQGFGKMWQKTYKVRLIGTDVTAADVIRAWKTNFASFWPKGNHFYGPLTGIAPGEVALLNVRAGSMALSTGVLVLYADDESFTLMTPQGHMFAGWITFSSFVEDGSTVAQAQVLMRASDPIYELGLALGGQRQEDKFWQHTLCAVAEHFGVDAPVNTTVVCVDPRRQWSHAGNIWSNAAVRTTIALPARVFRRASRG
jgi:hypothetical protein